MPINEYGTLDFPKNPEINDTYVDEYDTQWLYNGIDWSIYEPYYIYELPDVNISNLQVGDVFVWDGTKWSNSEDIQTVSDLQDVDISTIQNGETIVWDGTKYVNSTIGVPNGYIPDFVYVYKDPTIVVDGSPRILFDVVVHDTNTLYDVLTGKTTIKSSGQYLIYVTYDSDFETIQQSCYVRIYDQTNTLKSESLLTKDYNSQLNDLNHKSFSFVSLDIGDYIVVDAYNDQDTTQLDFKMFSIVVEEI